MYGLNIQQGDAKDESDHQYVQWSAEMTIQQQNRLAEHLVRYFIGIYSASRADT